MSRKQHRQRAAENQRLSRAANERMKELSTTFGYFTERASWICECAKLACVSEVAMTLPEYDWVRADPRHFLVAPGHDDPAVEHVIVDTGRFAVVELAEPLRRGARELVYYLRLEPDRRFEYVGDVVTDWLGYTPAEHYADPELGRRLVHPDDRALLDEIVARPELRPVTIRWIARDGTVVTTEHRLAPVYGEDSDLLGLAGRAILAEPDGGG